jgi:hypothetical protein
MANKREFLVCYIPIIKKYQSWCELVLFDETVLLNYF